MQTTSQSLYLQNFEVALDRETRGVSIGGVPVALDSNGFDLLCQFVAYTRLRRRPTTDYLAQLVCDYHVSSS